MSSSKQIHPTREFSPKENHPTRKLPVPLKKMQQVPSGNNILLVRESSPWLNSTNENPLAVEFIEPESPPPGNILPKCPLQEQSTRVFPQRKSSYQSASPKESYPTKNIAPEKIYQRV